MTPDPATLLHLQRTAGNRAVGRVLARDHTHKDAPIPQAPPAHAYTPPGKLSPADREILESGAAHRVDQAFTAFGNAVAALAASFKAEEKAKAEILAATLDIFFGLAAPFFAQRLAASGSKLATAADALGKKLSKEGASTVKAVGSSDILKESFKAVGKIGTTAIKLEAGALFGESDVDVFARRLKSEFHAGAQAVTDALSSHRLTDEQLVATWLAYDVEYTNEAAYVDALKRKFADFKEFVRPIGHETVSSGGMTGGGGVHSQTVRGAWISQPGGGRLLVLVDEQSSATGPWSDTSRSSKVVPPEMVPYVVEKTVREFGKVETIPMPWDPPDPNSEVEMIRRHLEQVEKIRKQADEAERRRKAKEAADFVKSHPDWQVKVH